MKSYFGLTAIFIASFAAILAGGRIQLIGVVVPRKSIAVGEPLAAMLRQVRPRGCQILRSDLERILTDAIVMIFENGTRRRNTVEPRFGPKCQLSDTRADAIIHSDRFGSS